jgi:hypothetical protein
VEKQSVEYQIGEAQARRESTRKRASTVEQSERLIGMAGVLKKDLKLIEDDQLVIKL